MNKCSHLPILCVLLLAFQGVLCSEFAKSEYAVPKLSFHDDVSSGDIFKLFWRNSKQRRSVKSATDGQLKITDQIQTNKPQFDCGDRVLTVLLKHADVNNIQIYGPHGDQLQLDHLAAFCGVSIKPAMTGVCLVFNYDSCYVKQEPTKYVLSLSWYGTDHDLSCPVSVTPPSIVCKNNAMELTVVDGTADELSVALNGEWAPLLYVATQCWHRELSNQGALTFSVPYTSCGVTVRDGNFNLDLKLKDKMIPLSCPYEPMPAFLVKDPGLSETNQPPPQREPDVYYKPPTVFPTKAVASQTVDEEQAFPFEKPTRNAARSRSLHRHFLPKLPNLPGSFNLAVNFPFSIPVPTRHADRDHLSSKPVALTPAPTSAPTPDPTDSSSEFSSSVQNRQPPVSEQMQEELTALVTKAPKSEYQYMQYPYKFEKPTSTSSETEPSPAQEYQLSRGSVPSAALYQPYGSAQNFPKPNPLQVNPAFASLAQYIPPGYFLCSYNNQQPPIHPHMFQHPVPNQPLQYQNPIYQKPDITRFAPANPAVPPMKGYSEQQLTSAEASSPLDSGTTPFQPTQYFQPSQYQQYLYQSSYGRQGFTSPLSPASQLIPINLQSHTRPHPGFQDSRPFQPQYYQKPSQPRGSDQQPWSTSQFPVSGFSQESRPFMSASSQAPEYLQYQTGGDQSLDLRSVVHTPGTGISSHSQYQPSQISTFPYPPLRPEMLSSDFSTENTGFSPKGFFQPWSKAPVPSPRASSTGNHPVISLPPPAHFPLQDKTEAQVVQLPYSQGPSVRYMQNPHVHPERPSGPRSRKPQNDTLPLYQFFRQESLPKDLYVPPNFRSASPE